MNPPNSLRRQFPRIALLVAIAVFCNQPTLWGEQARRTDTRTASHFLEQATFGPTAADVAFVESAGMSAWLEQQFATPESPIPDGLDGNQVRNQLFLNMANGNDQLRQRMMFALSQIIVVSANKTGSGPELTPWVRLLSRNAFGNFRTLLREVTVSPTMGKYLDMAYSRRATATSSPNENYARELLQLFTIGLWELNQDGTLRRDAQNQPIPTYTQATIREMARALTGWTFPTMPGATARDSNPQYFVGDMLPRVNTHDTGAKTIFGVTLPANQSSVDDMEDVLDIVFAHPNVPPFIATRLIRSLVTSNPSPAYIQRVANAFANNGQGVRGDLRAVLTAVLIDPEASSFGPEDGRLKDPILHIIGLGRALGAQITNPATFSYLFNNLTQQVLNPQTVFSFYSPLSALPGHFDLYGPEFQIYPPALAIQRANFIYSILNGGLASAFNVDLAPFTALAATPAALVDRVNQTLMFGRMSAQLHDLIVAATNAVPVSSPRERALGAVYLAAISSEYSVYTGESRPVEMVVQPPTGLTVASVVGNVVTLRWNAPLIGPTPTSYVLEGGVSPGQVLASMPTGHATTTISFAAPPGAFYLRVYTMAGAQRSRASSEIRAYVGVSAAPTAPSNLLGMVNGSTLGLSWRNTFGGGAPTSMVLDVTGSATTSLALGNVETFSFAGVPAGTYTFSVRALNDAGSSGASNSVTLTFPSTCSGAPQTPINFMATRNGNAISLTWQPALTGGAALSYEVNVTGTAVARVPVTARTLTSAVGAGTYNFSVRAVNQCGNSGYSAVQTITVP